MPLSILLPMVVTGIAGIVVLLHLLGLSRTATLTDEAAAERAWLREFLCQNRTAALIETAQGRGLVWPMGADTTARYLRGARITRTATGLCITLPDYTAPRIRLHLAAQEADQWPAYLKEPA